MISGKLFIAVLSGVTTAGAYQGSIDDGGDVLDATDGRTGGYTDTETGAQDFEARITGFHRDSEGPWPGIRFGSVLTAVKFYPHGITGGYWYAAAAIVTKAGNEVRVRDRVEYSATIKNKGAFTWVPAA